MNKFPHASNRNQTPKLKEQGMALILALLVVSIVTAIAVTLMTSSHLRNTRIYRQIDRLVDYGYYAKVESFAIKALKHDKDFDLTQPVNEQHDHCEDIWATPLKNATTDGEGYFGGFLSDLDGRFNLNSVNYPAAATPDQSAIFPRTTNQLVFMNLLMSFNYALSTEITGYLAAKITAALVDWIDNNDAPIPQNLGAESGYYQGLGFSYVPANQPMVEISELLEVLQVVDDQVLAGQLYELLLPHVTIWPRYGDFKLNVNTMNPVLLRSVITPKLQPPVDINNYEIVSDEVFSEFKVNRPYESVLDLENDLKISNEGLAKSARQIDTTNLVLTSDTFELTSEVALGEISNKLYTIFQRFPKERRKGLRPSSVKEFDVKVLSKSRQGSDSSPCN